MILCNVLIGGRLGLLVQCEVPETMSEHLQGLQGRPGIPDGAGMLFNFAPLRQTVPLVAMRMGSVSFPLDMLFIEDDRITGIATVTPGAGLVQGPARKVLELSGGWCRRYGVTEGTSFQVLT